jgi:hypothetical protein
VADSTATTSLALVRAAAAWRWAVVAATVGALLCGALLAPAASHRPARALAWLLFLGSSTHVATTGWLYAVPSVRRHARRHRNRYVVAPVLLVIVGGGTAFAASPGVMAWVLLPFFAWQFHHFQKQNVGMVALSASSARLSGLRRAERRAICAAGLCGVAGLVTHPALLQLDMRPVLGDVFPVAAFGYGIAVLSGLVLLSRRPRSDRPASFTALYVTALLFPLPIFVFTSPYAAVGGMTIAHGLQYLLLVGLVARGAEHPAVRHRNVALLCAVGLAGGVLLSVLSHLHGATPFLRVLFGAYLGVVCAHFVVDAGLWRLRDPFPRAFLSARVPFLFPGARSLDDQPVADRSAPDITWC